MFYFYLLWAICGIFLGMFYSFCLRQEIRFMQKQKSKTAHRNLTFSIFRIAGSSAVLIFAFKQDLSYGLICLLLFLLSKNLSLFLFVREKNETKPHSPKI